MGGVEKSQKNMQRERRYGREGGKEGGEEGREGRRDVNFYDVKFVILESKSAEKYPKSKHSVLEVSTKVKKTRSYNAGRGGREGGRHNKN